MAKQKYAVYRRTHKGDKFVGWYDTLAEAKRVKAENMKTPFDDVFIQREDPNLYSH